MTLRDDVLAAAQTFTGTPYRLDPPPDGVHNLDCSLFVLKAFERAGAPFSGVRTAEQIRQACIPIGFDAVQPGDLIFFENTYDTPGASHVGISYGAGTRRMIDANESHGVGETNIGTTYWQEHILEARRPPQFATTAAPAARPLGVDVASYQGSPDWGAVAASGVAFGFTKLTEGTGYVNPTAQHNWTYMRTNGVYRGAYHFARPDHNDAEDEANFFASRFLALGDQQPGDILVLDLEDGSGNVGGWALDWLRLVEARLGWKPIVYTGKWFIDQTNLSAFPALGEYGLWLAAYQSTMPPAPDPWEIVAFWQYSDAGSVPGIAGNVDMDQFNGAADRIPLYGKPGTVPPPPPPPDPTPALIARQLDLIHAAEAEIRRLTGVGT